MDKETESFFHNVTLVRQAQEQLCVFDFNNYAPVFVAVSQGITKALEQLLKLGANLNIFTDGISPIHFAALLGKREIFQKMHEMKFSNLFNQKTNDQDTPASILAEKGYVTLLCDFHLWGIDLTPSNNKNILHIAAEKGQIGVLQIFHHWKFNLDEPVNAFGLTPLWCAVFKNQIKVVLYLLNKVDINRFYSFPISSIPILFEGYPLNKVKKDIKKLELIDGEPLPWMPSCLLQF